MSRKPVLRMLVLIAVAATQLASASEALGQGNQSERPRRANRAAATPGPSIWRDPGAVERLDFVNGPGGAGNAPRPPFTFIEEDTGGTNPKVKVKDATGRKWGVKWGGEVHSEVFASRIAWAAGYWVEPCYFVKSGRIDGVRGLKRARKHVSSDGSFTNARFELKEKGISKQTDKESWRWDTNPFARTRELDGLKIVIMLTSNWDPKDQRDESSNTAIHTVKKTGEVRYVFGDWGATMGKWGGVFSREKWDCDGYAHQTRKFVTGVEGNHVLFGYDGKHSSEMRNGISVSTVAWVLRYLGRISDQQIGAGLKASDATAEEVACFTSAIRERIDQLRRAVGDRASR